MKSADELIKIQSDDSDRDDPDGPQLVDKGGILVVRGEVPEGFDWEAFMQEEREARLHGWDIFAQEGYEALLPDSESDPI